MDILPQFTDVPPYYWPAVLVVLTIVIFVHELGHFLVARWCGVAVKIFSIGFGPEMFGFTDRKGTRWRVSWIPLGGYVKFIDDENIASAPDHELVARMSDAERAGSFQLKPLGVRSAVVAAGPIANFILAILIFAFVFSTVGQDIASPRVYGVQPNSPAEKAGFQVGDLVVSIDDEVVDSFKQMQKIVSGAADKPLKFIIRRNDQKVELTATPRLRDELDISGTPAKQARLGIEGPNRQNNPTDWAHKRYDPITSLGMGVAATYEIITNTFVVMRDILMGKQSAEQIGSLGRITEWSTKMAALGAVSFAIFIASLSVSIGFINLFPIPMLDGGHLMFYGIEAVRGRPLSPRSQEIGFRIGLVIVLGLMIFALSNDAHHYYKRFG